MKRFLVAAAMAVTLSTAPVAGMLPALAPVVFADDWCAVDPLIVIVTPKGNVANVHLTDYAQGVQHLAALQQVQNLYRVEPTSDGKGTNVTVYAAIPNDLGWGVGQSFPARMVISTGTFGSGTVLATADGQSSALFQLTFTLNVQ